MAKSNQKSKVHARKMEEKRLDKVYENAVNDTCRLVLLVMYASLADEFGFGMKRLNRLRKRMDRYSVHIRDKEDTGVSQTIMMQMLEERGIDVTLIGKL